MNENQQIPTPVDTKETEHPDDPRWYLQQMYSLAVEPIESGSVTPQVVR